MARAFSTLPWLDRLLRKVNLAPRLQLLLRQADLKWTVGRLVLLTLLSGLGCWYLVDLRTHVFLLATLIGGVAGVCPLLYVLAQTATPFRSHQSAPARCHRPYGPGHSGGSQPQFRHRNGARESPEPVRGEFRQCYDEQNFGLDLRTAMNNLIHRVPVHEIRIIAAGVLIQKDTGGNLTEILEKVAYLIREDFRLQRQVGVHTAQGRISGYILAGMPIALGIGMYLLNPARMSLLWTRPLGVKMLWVRWHDFHRDIIIRKIVGFRV